MNKFKVGDVVQVVRYEIKELPPFNIEIDGKVYTDYRSRNFAESHRLQAHILANIVRNIFSFTDDVCMGNQDDGLVTLYVDDDEYFEANSIDLYFIR